MRCLLGVFLALGLCASVGAMPGFHGAVEFDRSWREQGFFRLFSNRYDRDGLTLGVRSNRTVSLLWRILPADQRDVSLAAWQWQVTEGVAPTDLSLRGGDDRNLSLYFVFVDAETAADLRRGSARRVLRNPNARALAYVWGGDHARGDILPSPYHPGLRTIVLRGAGTGTFAETVDLAADHLAAFGEDPGVLVGIGVSADSDDTRGRIRAEISGLHLH